MAVKAGQIIGKLSARRVETEKKRGLYGDGGGLYLKVSSNGRSKSWIVRWSKGGRAYKLGLGATHTVPLAMARERATEIRRLILDGIDPREARRAAAVAQAKSIAFDDAASRYIESHRAGWKTAKQAAQWQATLSTYASPVFGRLPVSAIDTGLVMRVLQPIWTTKNATAFQLRGRIEAVLGWAKVNGYREGENPAAWKDNLDHLLPPSGKVSKTTHHPSMPYDDLPAFVDELRDRDDISARALEFLILTATRTGEVLGARWDEIDLAGKLWTVPAARMKAGVEHRVPLCDRAVVIIESMTRSGDHVFAGVKRGRPLIGKTFLTLLHRMGRDDVTAHGFRSSFRDWAAEQTNFPERVVEAALAHAHGNRTTAAYFRSDLFDKRRELMAAWVAHCDSRATTGKVVAIR